MCGQHGRLVRRVEEDPNPGNIPPRVVLRRHARANEPLPSIDRLEALGGEPVKPKFTYPLTDSPEKKISKITSAIYGATDVILTKKARNQLKAIKRLGLGKLPICMAKTQYSFSTDPNAKGAPKGFIVPIRELRLSAGAEFVVVVTGDIMTMPGLPSVPASNNIYLNKKGQIEGLF